MKKLLIPSLLLLILSIGVYYFINQPKPANESSLETSKLLDSKTKIIPEEIMFNNDPSAVACTMDVNICPDGSAVGRVAPDCQFAPCP